LIDPDKKRQAIKSIFKDGYRKENTKLIDSDGSEISFDAGD
jgi:hypothetical protein